MLVECLVFGLISWSMTEGRHEVQQVFAESNSKVVLPCVCNASSPAITWKRNQGTVWRQEKSGMQFWGYKWLQRGAQRVRCPHPQLDRGDCSLHINDVREDDGGMFVCSFNSGGQSETRLVMLRVITVSFSSVSPVAGMKVSMRCDVSPQPVGASVQWGLNNSTFVSTSGENPKAAQWTVEETASVSLTGKWTCVVAHQGLEGRASADLTVKGILHPSRDDVVMYAAVGRAATLPCVFSPGLSPSETSWHKPSGPLPPSFSSSSPASKPAWDQSARLGNVSFEDEGIYRCAGVVGGQSLSRRMQLVVAKVGRSVSWRKTVALTCQLTDTSEVARYQWVHVTFDPSGTPLVEPIQEGKTLYMTNGNDEGVGDWVCRFYSKEGLLGNVTHRIIPQNGPLTESTSPFNNTSMALSLSVLLVLLVLIVGQLYRHQQWRTQIFHFSALETILHARSNERDKGQKCQEKK
ncbi:protein sidekick-2-like [Nerophis ophidion]|uniref:protein sidekick-2-like n=1 Tax=Nerophis ophidion TaxID=159077 RepID=UPI002AE06DF8|nr:protein sidekick-2-like [Nerophis ophidion]